ncbi:MAG: S8 family serine peptidase [Planctomycetales bacterium]|nr:S8 family serine peptidase [Planctomycetales bacterium]
MCVLAGRAIAADQPDTRPSSEGTAVVPVEPGALDFSRTRALWQQDPNLTGQGIRILYVCPSQTYINDRPQNDYRFNMNHHSLHDADVAFEDGSNGRYGLSSHETACAGILLGLDEQAEFSGLGAFEYRGACPDASVDVYEFRRFAALYLFGKQPFTADIVTLSFGNHFEEWWTRGLERAAAEKDFLVVAGIGNGTDAITPKPLYPAAGSNVLGVGVVDAVVDAEGTINLADFSTPKAIYSSIGPTEDARCKPDIVAPGTALVPVHTSNNGYRLVHNWSSLSAPVVSGTAALLWQEAASNAGLRKAFSRPGKSLVLKAVLMNSARKLPFWHKGQIGPDDDHAAPLDFVQGAGLADGLAAYDQLTAGPGTLGQVQLAGWDNRVLADGERGYEYAFEVSDSNQVITATLCWNRAYQPQYPFGHLSEQDADLRLELWGTEPNDPSRQVLLDYSDSAVDNVEHIYFASDPNYAAYAIRVRISENRPANPAIRQRFAVAWSVGPNRQAGNPWWYDLNADDKVDASDQLIYAILQNEILSDEDTAFLEQPLKLSAERLELLARHWPDWKRYLADWELSRKPASAVSDTSPAIDTQDLAGDVAAVQ